MTSFKYNNVYIKDYDSICGPEEHNSNIKCPNYIKDYYNGEKNFIDSEIKMQSFVLNRIIKRNKLVNPLIIGGDLLNQITITSYNLNNKNIPFLGVYNACSTMNESLIILSNFIESNMIKEGIAITSSHGLNSEKQYRYPIEYGSIKKEYQTFTTTGAAALLLSSKKTNIKVESSTIGTVVDYGIKDASNMGAIMAPSASKTLNDHLKDLKRNIDYYDLIITGDLGKLGSEIFLKLIKEDYNYIPKKYYDASSIIYKDSQNKKQGGSGPIIVPLVLINKIFKSNYKKILILATGSLHSPVMVNLKKSIPSITHAISIEVEK